MKRWLRHSLICLPLASLFACGGGNESTPGNRAPQAALRQATIGRTTADYETIVQQVFVGYFGRPADVGGLAYFEDLFLRIGAPTQIIDFNLAYATNAALRQTIDNFGASQESQALYPGDDNAFVAALYRNLFSREPDAPGQAFWVNLLQTGQMTRGRAAISLMAGAQSTDITVINTKAQVAKNFTAAITTPLQMKGYDGLAANAIVRTLLGNVVLGTDPAAFQTNVSSTIATLANTAGTNSFNTAFAIIQNRCTPCHATHPTFPGFLNPPAGVKLETADQVHSLRAAIISASVDSEFMPFGNATNMTTDERLMLKAWNDLGAP